MLTFLGIVTVFLLATGSVAAYGSDNPEGFEEKEYLPGLDIWVNQTAPLQYAPSQNGEEIVNQGWELQRYILLPESVDLSTWIIYDTDAIFVVGGFGGPARVSNDNSLIKSVSAEDKTEAGLTGFTGRSTDGITKIDANDRVAQIDATVLDATYAHFAGTTSMSDVEANYTVPENEINSGIAYEAGDSKTINEYGSDVAEGDGKSLNSVYNASMIGYAYASQDDLQSVVWTFDESTAAAPGQGLSILKRAKIWLKAKKLQKQTRNGFFGTTKSSRTDDLNLFKKISLASSALGGRPTGVKNFFSKIIPTGHFGASKVGTGAVTKTFAGRIKGIMQVLLLLGLIGLLVWYFKFRKK